MIRSLIPDEIQATIDGIIRIGNRAVAKAQEESRRLGVPNVYSIDGQLYYEMPNGELSATDPFRKGKSEPDQSCEH